MVVVVHYFLGKRFGHEPFVDPIMHFVGGAAIAYFFRQACSAARDRLGQPNELALDLLAFGLGVTAAMLWELGEFSLVVAYDITVRHDLPDTMRDLVVGTFGAGCYVYISGLFRKQTTRLPTL